MSGRGRAIQRIRASAAAADVRALLAVLRAYMEDSTVAACAIKALWRVLTSHTIYLVLNGDEEILKPDLAETALQALHVHSADARLTHSTLHLLSATLAVTDLDALSASHSAPHFSLAVVSALRQHSEDADVLNYGCEVLHTLQGDITLCDMFWSSDVSCAAVDVLSTRLRTHLNDVACASTVLPTLADLFSHPDGHKIGFATAGSMELITSALRAHHGSTSCDIKVHQNGCRAIGSLCTGGDVTRADSCHAMETVLQSLRSYPDSELVQASGLRALAEYAKSGGALDCEDLGREPFQAAIFGMRQHGSCPKVLQVAFAVLCSIFAFPCTDDIAPASWVVEVLSKPEALALLKRSLRELENFDEAHPTRAMFVNWMTYGACAGCGKLQEAKMKLCARCKCVPYCSEACHVSHWPVHKLECVRRPADRLAAARKQLDVE